MWRDSPKGIFFRRAKSTFFSPGPSRLLMLTFPNDPGAGLAKAQVLKNVPGTHGFELALIPGTKSGRCCPSELAKLALPSVTVNHVPAEIVTIPDQFQSSIR